MLPRVDVSSAPAVREYVSAVYLSLFPGRDPSWMGRVFTEVDALYAGRTAAYAPLDLSYHDLCHTLMATVCMAEILGGYQSSGPAQPLSPREFELGIAAMLLHDSGYARLRTDTSGTGAKYTYCHIVRSCALAASLLPGLGATELEVEDVLVGISCTGLTASIKRERFRSETACFLGCTIGTADYLGQLSDPVYLSKLGSLYREFRESDDYANVPAARRTFSSEEDLVRRTPNFWAKFVRPRLDGDYQGVYRYLARPYPGGPNAYLDAVEANMEKVRRRVREMDGLA